MDSAEGYLLISVTTLVLVAFVISFLIIMLIYRKRKVEYNREKEMLQATFARELLQTQVEVQKDTMQYIGREIHDNVGQKLTLAALYAQQIDYESRYPQIGERIATVSTIINESLSELRSLSKSLTSDYIARFDLATLIRNECDKIEAGRLCNIDYSNTATSTTVSYAVKNIVLRIIQEFIQNSLKHAACQNIRIDINEAAEGLMILIEDDGKGFTVGTGSSGIGLLNMEKRAQLVGALFSLRSEAGKGTRMNLIIPSTQQL